MNQIELYSKVTEHLYPLTGDNRINRVAGVYQVLWKLNDKRLYPLVNTIGADLTAFGCQNPVGHPSAVAATIKPLDLEKSPEESPLGLSFKYGSLSGTKLMDFAKKTIVAIGNHFAPEGTEPTTRYKEAVSVVLEKLETDPALTVARIRVLLHDENVNLKTAVFRILGKVTTGLAQEMIGHIWYEDGSSVHPGLLNEFEDLL